MVLPLFGPTTAAGEYLVLTLGCQQSLGQMGVAIQR